MSLLQSAAHLGIYGTLLLVCACHGGHKHRHHDSSIDPVGDGTDAGPLTGGLDAGGGLLITGQFNSCPRAAIFATPIQTFLGDPVMVTSRSVDPEGQGLTYEWTAEPDGDFDEATGQSALYNCKSIGRKTLSLSATDTQGCEANDSLEVSCVNVKDFVQSGMQQLPGKP